MPFCQAVQEGNNNGFSLTNNIDMNRKQFRKQAYIRPAIKVIVMPQEQLLQPASGQHNPGHHGTGPSSAKQGWFDFDEEDEEEDNSAETEENSWGIERY